MLKLTNSVFCTDGSAAEKDSKPPSDALTEPNLDDKNAKTIVTQPTQNTPLKNEQNAKEPAIKDSEKRSDSETDAKLVNNIKDEINDSPKPAEEKVEEEVNNNNKNPEEEEVYEPEIENDYATGMSKINNTHGQKDHRAGYYYLGKAASRGHRKAKEEIAIAMLFGDHMTRNISGAREIFEDLSTNFGSPRAQFYIGFLHATGLGVKSSQAKALTYFTFAALGGDPTAQMAMGYRYWSSVNVVNSCEVALSYYRKVATSVANRISSNTVGTIVHRIRLYDEEEKISGTSQVLLDDDLVQYYQLLADRGDIQAQYGLGLLHYQGTGGLNMQYDKALHYFSKAAESGNNYAMAYLGKLYLEGGVQVKQDNATALRYFKMAAEKGNPIGQAGLGIIYFYGSGVERDYAKALK